MISTNPSSFLISKPSCLQPIIHTNLVTSTPADHQATKRIKGLSGYSEHYKGNPIEHPSLGRILPFRSKDYRKARELNLELWDPENKIDFLEKFLKNQTNLKKIRIRVLDRGEKLTNILKQLSNIFGKISRINRIQVDFQKEQIGQALPFVLERLRSLKYLPKLKDISITLDGVELYPFSIALLKIGFDFPVNQFLITVKSPQIIENLMRKTPKFLEFDTIRIDSKKFSSLPEAFLDGIALVISKLNNFRELNLNYSNDLYLSLKPTFNILDTLFKTAPKLKVLKFGFAMKGNISVSMLKHPIFKAQSLEKVHISVTFYREMTTGSLKQIMDILLRIPKLYELSLKFNNYPMTDDEIRQEIMEKLIQMTSLRKLKLQLQYESVNISEKLAGSLICSVFKMRALEKLDLEIPTRGLDLSGNNEGESLGGNIEGLPRLIKMRLVLREYGNPIAKSILGVMELLGRCCRLRELEVDLNGCSIDYEGMTRILRENIGRLKGLQDFRLHVNDPQSVQTQEFVKILKEWVEVFEGMRSLQDVVLTTQYIDRWSPEAEGYTALCEKISTNKKYRLFDLNKRWYY